MTASVAGRDIANPLGATPRRCGPSRATPCPNSCISRTAARGTAGSCCSTATRTRSPGASTTSSSPGRHLRPRGLPRRTPRGAKTNRASSRRSSCTISPSRRLPRNRATRTASKPAAAPVTTTTTTTTTQLARAKSTTTAKRRRCSRSSTTPRGRGSSGRSSTTWSGSCAPARAPRRAACEASGASDARALAPTTPRDSPRGSMNVKIRSTARCPTPNPTLTTPTTP